ncbi:MAG: deoxyribodipyrimidine photo-lyase, partial [Rhodothermia bacterium]|nr:deoxyribodipyrimidine photo-lyase [Rhodothermia bacterium]
MSQRPNADPMTVQYDEVRRALPTHLSERVRVISEGSANDLASPGDAEFVLYWMHHAVRAHENPALAVAVHAGNSMGLPVVVYQGLAGKHRFNSDRHHTFIMEGARDVQRQLEDRGIRYAFHLGPTTGADSALREVAGWAALVIAEDFPAPPFPAWTQSLASSISAPVWCVDACCIVPMQSVGKSFDRAFKFRSATKASFEERVPRAWTDVEPAVSQHSGHLGIDVVDLADADIAALCSRCDIDHSIGPAAHTPGGSMAGYERWTGFVENGLAQYARLRNDAAVTPPQGVSRLSPYLHHGHVSPFRIAREAKASGAAGASKFLDELLIWRELAHNFCFYHDDVESLVALPAWARETLDQHKDDARPASYSWETLARGRTDNRLWDLAQRSLLAHGELHNNVRMTWGKALLSWTASPEEALQMLIDLNHRYALDGNDPNSYGGLLWCLGLFDRPFAPPKPVFGTVRPRSIERHAERLDLDEYEVHVSRPG